MTSNSLKACMHVLVFQGSKNNQGQIAFLQPFESRCDSYNDTGKAV